MPKVRPHLDCKTMGQVAVSDFFVKNISKTLNIEPTKMKNFLKAVALRDQDTTITRKMMNGFYTAISDFQGNLASSVQSEVENFKQKYENSLSTNAFLQEILSADSFWKDFQLRISEALCNILHPVDPYPFKIDRQLVKRDLNKIQKLKSNGNYGLYIYDPMQHDMQEDSMLLIDLFSMHELASSRSGYGTGQGIKTDKHNKNIYADDGALIQPGFRQIIIVDEADKNEPKVVAGYRADILTNRVADGEISSPLAEYFHIPLKYANFMELGTASTIVRGKPLDMIWDCLAYFYMQEEAQKIDGFIGKLTIPKEYPKLAAEFAMYYMMRFFGVADDNNLRPRTTAMVSPSHRNIEMFDKLIAKYEVVGDYSVDRKRLRKLLPELDPKTKRLPNMFGTYLERCPGITSFGVVQSGAVREVGILVPNNGFDPETLERHMSVWEEDQ